MERDRAFGMHFQPMVANGFRELSVEILLNSSRRIEATLLHSPIHKLNSHFQTARTQIHMIQLRLGLIWALILTSRDRSISSV